MSILFAFRFAFWTKCCLFTSLSSSCFFFFSVRSRSPSSKRNTKYELLYVSHSCRVDLVLCVFLESNNYAFNFFDFCLAQLFIRLVWVCVMRILNHDHMLLSNKHKRISLTESCVEQHHVYISRNEWIFIERIHTHYSIPQIHTHTHTHRYVRTHIFNDTYCRQ